MYRFTLFAVMSAFGLFLCLETPSASTCFQKPDGEELLENWDFEQGTCIGKTNCIPIGWETWEVFSNDGPDYWYNKYSGPITGKCATSQTSYVSRHIVFGTADGGLYQAVSNVSSEKTYLLSGWVWVTDPNTETSPDHWDYMAAIGWDPTGQVSLGGAFPTVQYLSDAAVNENQWNLMTAHISPSEDVTQLSIWTRTICNAGGYPYYADFDEVSLIDLSTVDATPTPTLPPIECVECDADCNGRITPKDALLIFHAYLGILEPNRCSEECPQAADCCADGRIRLSDALGAFKTYLTMPFPCD